MGSGLRDVSKGLTSLPEAEGSIEMLSTLRVSEAGGRISHRSALSRWKQKHEVLMAFLYYWRPAGRGIVDAQ